MRQALRAEGGADPDKENSASATKPAAAEKPATVEKPAAKPVKQSKEKSTEKPVAATVEKAVEKPVATTTAESAEQSVAAKATEPVEKAVAKPVSEPDEQAAAKPVATTMAEATDKPAEKPVAAAGSTEKTAEKQSETPLATQSVDHSPQEEPSLPLTTEPNGPEHAQPSISSEAAAAARPLPLKTARRLTHVAAHTPQPLPTRTPSVVASPPVDEGDGRQYWVKLATFSNEANAEALFQTLSKLALDGEPLPISRTNSSQGENNYYRVRVGPFTDRSQAERAIKLVQQQVNMTGTVVVLNR